MNELIKYNLYQCFNIKLFETKIHKDDDSENEYKIISHNFRIKRKINISNDAYYSEYYNEDNNKISIDKIPIEIIANDILAYLHSKLKEQDKAISAENIWQSLTGQFSKGIKIYNQICVTEKLIDCALSVLLNLKLIKCIVFKNNHGEFVLIYKAIENENDFDIKEKDNLTEKDKIYNYETVDQRIKRAKKEAIKEAIKARKK